MITLGNGLHDVNAEEALSVFQSRLEILTRLRPTGPAPTLDNSILATKTNVANCLLKLGRVAEGIAIQEEIYADHLKRHGTSHPETVRAGFSRAITLVNYGQFNRAKTFMRETDLITIFQRTYGADNPWTFQARGVYADALIRSNDTTPDDLREAVNILEDSTRRARRVLGTSHPEYIGYEQRRDIARERLKLMLAGA
jgi:hypothetical protein